MAELNQEPKFNEQNCAAIADEKFIKPNMPETAVPDIAGEHAKTPAKAPIPFNEALCHLEEWGLDSDGDLNMNFNMANFSLDPLMKRFKVWKKNLEEQIKSMVVMKLPDAVRPLALALRIIEYLDFIIKLVQCSISIIKQILTLIKKLTDAINKTINKITAYINRQTGILKQLQAKIMKTPSWFLVVMMKNINKEILNYMHGPSDLLTDVAKLTQAVKQLQTVIKNTPNFIEHEINSVKSNMKRACDAMQHALSTIEAMNWKIQQPDLLQAFAQVATPEEKYLLQKMLNIAGSSENINVYSNNRYRGDNVDGILPVTGGGSTGTDSNTQIAAANILGNTSNSLSQASAVCQTYSNLNLSETQNILALQSVLGETVSDLDTVSSPTFNSPITQSQINNVQQPLNNMLIDLANFLKNPNIPIKNASAKLLYIASIMDELSKLIDSYMTHDPIVDYSQYNNLSSGGETGTDTITDSLSDDKLNELKNIAQLLSAQIDISTANTDQLRMQASEINSEANILLARLERIQEIQESIDISKEQLVSLDIKRQELTQKYLEYEDQLDQQIDLRQLGYTSSAFSFSMTNNQDEFVDLDGVTNNGLLHEMATALDDVWVDIFNANEPGVIMMTNDRYGAFELSTDIKIASSGCGLNLRLLIDNGLWVLEAYSNGNSLTADVIDGNRVYNFGKFTSVPTAPCPGMTRPITADEFKQAFNNPMALNKNHELVIAVPIGTDLSSVITHTDDTDFLKGYNGDAWMRYYSQREIDELEALYMGSLQALNLSAHYPVDNELNKKQQTIWQKPDGTFIVRNYAFPTDTQISDLLLNKKPYHGMKLPASVLSLQFAKSARNQDSISALDKTICPFGITANWGFISSSK